MKSFRHQLIKKYVRAFLHTYKHILKPSDLKSLSAFAYFLKHHQTLSFLAYHELVDHQKRIDFYMKLLMYSAGDVRPELLPPLERLLVILSDHERLELLPDTLALLVVRFGTVIGYQHALVSTSHEITQLQKDDIIEHFKKLTRKNIDAEFTIDPTLIAGIKIVSQEYLWESSIAEKINRIGRI